MKKYISGVVTGLILAFSISAFAGNIANAFFTSDIKLKVNGQYKNATFVNVDGTNYCKVRDLVDAVGGTTSWDNTTKTIIIETEVKNVNTVTNDIVMEPAKPVENPINPDVWIGLRDFAMQYKDAYKDYIMPIQNKLKSSNDYIEYSVDFEKGTLKVASFRNSVYLNIDDLKRNGLMD